MQTCFAVQVHLSILEKKKTAFTGEQAFCAHHGSEHHLLAATDIYAAFLVLEGGWGCNLSFRLSPSFCWRGSED